MPPQKKPRPPEDVPFTADELLATIRARGGRVHRLPEVAVFCLTMDGDLAHWLLEIGGVPFRSAAGGGEEGYERAKGGPIEWDIFIQRIPVRGDRTIWEAAGPATYGSRETLPEEAA